MNPCLTLLTTTHLTAIGYDNDYGTTITLPVGRIVWGHPGKPQPSTDQHGNPKIGKDGQQMMETSFGIAIPNAEFEAHVWPVMHAEAAKLFPNGQPDKFSWKFKRETDVDNDGNPYSQREGRAGCYVLTISTVIEPPRMLKWNGTQWQQMDASEVKTGDYVQPEVTFKVNKPTNATHTPGLYVNPEQIAFVGHGEEIVNKHVTDPSQAFGNGPPPLPPGASATPTAPGGGAPMPGQPGNAAMPGGSTTAPPANMAGQQPAASAAPAPAQANPAPPPPAAPAPTGPQRPTDPAHIHDNGNGTEQWFDPATNAWDGGAHPAGGGSTLPPPATGFVDQAAGQPAAATMPGAPPPR